jgi:gas vesicle protein
MAADRNFSYFFLGVGIGVAIGILFAPRSGGEVRHLIRDKAGEGKDYLSRQGTALRESTHDLVDKGRSAIQRQRENISSAMEAGKQAYRDVVSDRKEPDPADTGV